MLAESAMCDLFGFYWMVRSQKESVNSKYRLFQIQLVSSYAIHRFLQETLSSNFTEEASVYYIC
jgi:hypothetical protein